MVKRADSILEYIEVHDQDALQGITQSGSTCGWSFYSQKAVYAPGVRYTIIGQGGASETVFVDEIKDAYGGYIVTAHRIDMEAERSMVALSVAVVDASKAPASSPQCVFCGGYGSHDPSCVSLLASIIIDRLAGIVYE